MMRVYEIWNRISERVIAVAVLFGLSFTVFARVLLRPDVMIFGNDFLQFYFWENFAREVLARGGLPLWNPFFYSGSPFLANPQTRVLYPLTMLLRFVPLNYSFSLGLMLHLGWAGLGMYELTRSLNFRRASAFVAGIAFMLCGFIVPRLEAGHIDILYSVAWLPWSVLCWRKMLSESKWSGSLWLALVMVMQFLAGYPSLSLMTVILLVVIAFETVLPTLRRGDWRAVMPMAARAALSVILTAAFAAPQLLPTLEFTRLSTRAAGLALECIQPFALTPVDFATLVLTKPPVEVFIAWERVMYFGALPLLLAAVGLFAPKNFWRWRTTLAAVFVVGVVLGAGTSLPFYQFIPLLTFFREPSHFIFFICFAGAGLASIGVERMLEWAQTDIKMLKRLGWIALALVVVTAIADVAMYRAQRVEGVTLFAVMTMLSAFSSPRYVAAALILFGASRMLRGRVGVTVIVGIVAIDLWLFSYPYLPIVPASSQTLSSQASSGIEPRMVSEPFMYANRSMAARVSNAQGFSPMIVASYANFVRGDRLPDSCPDIEHVDIRLDDVPLLQMLSVKSVEKNKSVSGEVSNYYPRVAWVGEAVSARANGEAIKLARAADFDPTKKVIIEGEVNRSASSGTGSIRITHYGTESLNVMIDSTSDGWFYINDVWYPGWKAWVNGEETQVYRANGTFRAVRVPSGQHTENF
ncbi:MAG: YfhO family protein [Chloroflexi bacterium]|nr:YfhO family protein [Chloroflexota bacterium]